MTFQLWPDPLQFLPGISYVLVVAMLLDATETFKTLD